MPKKRNSLVENINRRKRKGTSRPKSKSTVSKQSYRQMRQGWPSSKKKKTAKAKKSTRAKSTAKRGAKRKAGSRQSR